MILRTRGALIRKARRRILQTGRARGGQRSPDSHALAVFCLELLLSAVVAYSWFPCSASWLICWPEGCFISKPAFVGTRRAAQPTSSSFFNCSAERQQKKRWEKRAKVLERKRERECLTGPCRSPSPASSHAD